MPMVYRWKEQARVKINPQEAGERLERIRNKNGTLTPALVVKDAKSERSPLHSHFEWDDRVAATRYRLEQAGYLLRSIVVEVPVTGEDEPRTLRAFVSVDGDEGPEYDSIVRVLSDDERRRQAVERILAAARALAKEARQYDELAPLVMALDAFIELPAAA